MRKVTLLQLERRIIMIFDVAHIRYSAAILFATIHVRSSSSANMCKSFQLIYRELVIGLCNLAANRRFVRKLTGGSSQWKFSSEERHGIEHFK